MLTSGDVESPGLKGLRWDREPGLEVVNVCGSTSGQSPVQAAFLLGDDYADRNQNQRGLYTGSE
jgi:hypothetical protein